MQPKFASQMQRRQLAWRSDSKNGICREHGWQNGGQYPWILPASRWEQNLWPEIRSGTASALPIYLKRNHIQPHGGKNNLKSSWVLCANLYFPFGATPDGRELLAGFLRDVVSPDIRTVDKLHLEYAEEGNLHPAKMLGEPGGQRGSGQTSPDLAFHVNGFSGLILVENKWTEHSFYPCSARRRTSSEKRPGNPDPNRCNDIHSLSSDHLNNCHQCVWGRRYWDILRPVMDDTAFATLGCCPAAKTGYQLFRQQALAEGIAQSGAYDLVYSCVALDARNETLLSCLRRTGISSLENGWGLLFRGKARFNSFTHQQWFRHVARYANPSIWGPWMEYVLNRYGLEEA